MVFAFDLSVIDDPSARAKSAVEFADHPIFHEDLRRNTIAMKCGAANRVIPVGGETHTRLKIAEHEKLDIVAESFKLFNRTNVVQLGMWFGTKLTPIPTFAHPTEALNPRQFQFSLDLEF